MASSSEVIRNHAAFIWSVADLLRGDYKQSEYGRVILPLVVLRRLDCVLEPTKAKVLDRADAARAARSRTSTRSCARPPATSSSTTPRRSTMTRLLDDPANIADNLRAYIAGFSPRRRDVIEKFDFDAQIDRLDRAEPALPGRLASSPRSTCTPTPSPTSRWATSTRS